MLVPVGGYIYPGVTAPVSRDEKIGDNWSRSVHVYASTPARTPNSTDRTWPTAGGSEQMARGSGPCPP